MTMQETDKALDAVITELAVAVKPLVDDLEADPRPPTRNNYGRYLTILVVTGKGDEAWARIIALALIEAGAHHDGVTTALRICVGTASVYEANSCRGDWTLDD